jgi:hypothetical protein
MDTIEKAMVAGVIIFILVLVVGGKYIPSDSKFQDFGIGWFFIAAGLILLAAGAGLIKSSLAG